MEAYLKKLCFEYQVDEREVKELLARMEMVYLPQCPSRACILLFPAFCIHTRLMKERIEPSGFYLKGMLYCAITPVNML